MKYIVMIGKKQYLQKLGSAKTTENPLEAQHFRNRASARLAADAYQAQYSSECPVSPRVVQHTEAVE